MWRLRSAWLPGLLAALLAGASASAYAAGLEPAGDEPGQVARLASRPALPVAFTGAAPPALPETVSRDAEGHTTVRVVPLATALRVDGELDEELYRTVEPISDFIEVEPSAGVPATEKTEVWLSFDTDNIYVSLRASESHPERMVVNEMRRDSFSIVQNENFQFCFDTFDDHRNAVSFQFNPIGGRMDGQVTNESQFNSDWNPVWTLKVQRHAHDWTAEAAVPFKSLRYRGGTAQIWGFQARRIDRWKNETSYLTQLPANTGINGHTRVSDYAAMVGLEVPAHTLALDLKPYVTSSLTTDRTAVPALDNQFGKDAGFDVKYGVTQNLTADFTYRTDFAQVEADEQQVNLTRFGLFFPEKREFFLENQGLFQFATTLGNNFGGLGGDVPTLFYSRRIGLDEDRIGLGENHPVAIDGGGRVSGRIGRYSIGLLNIQTQQDSAFGIPSTNFGVVRVRRDLLRRSAVGLLYTRRSATAAGSGAAETYGADASFGFFQNLYFNGYWARTRTPGITSEDTSYRGQMSYNADRYGLQLERLNVGAGFDPEVGFLRRQAFTKNRLFLRFSPRPRQRFHAVRKFTYQGHFNLYDDPAGRMESREREVEFQMDLQTSDQLSVKYTDGYERLSAPFDIATNVTIPVGAYALRIFTAQFQVGQQRAVSGTWSIETGPFYDGHRTTVAYSRARVKINEHLAIEPTISVNRVTLPYGDFTAKLVSARTTYTITPLMFVSSLVQYNSSNDSLGTNIRLRWEYQPGSELFVVYNEGRETSLPGAFAQLQNRSLIFKVNRLFRF